MGISGFVLTMMQQEYMKFKSHMAQDFSTFACNSETKTLITQLQLIKPEPYLLVHLEGPKKSGKKHLVRGWLSHHHINREMEERYICDATALDNDPEAVFHVLTRAWHEGHVIFLLSYPAGTGRLKALADVRSRINGGVSLRIPPPCDLTLTVIIMRELQIHGMQIADHDMQYLLRRMPRDAQTAVTIGRYLADYMARTNKKITKDVLFTALSQNQ